MLKAVMLIAIVMAPIAITLAWVTRSTMLPAISEKNIMETAYDAKIIPVQYG